MKLHQLREGPINARINLALQKTVGNASGIRVRKFKRVQAACFSIKKIAMVRSDLIIYSSTMTALLCNRNNYLFACLMTWPLTTSGDGLPLWELDVLTMRYPILQHNLQVNLIDDVYAIWQLLIWLLIMAAHDALFGVLPLTVVEGVNNLNHIPTTRYDISIPSCCKGSPHLSYCRIYMSCHVTLAPSMKNYYMNI